MIKNSTRNSTTIQTITRGAQLLILLSFLMLGNVSKAQVNYFENFSVPGTPVFPVTSLPFGWAQGKFGAGIDADNYWDRMGTGATNPNCNPVSANAMMRYRSWYINTGEASFLASKRLDMRNIPGGGAAVSLKMYRDEGFVGFNDNIRVYVNTTPDMLGAPFQLTAAAINRPCGSAPIVACPVSYNVSGWNTYNFSIPNTFNGSSVYVIILGTSADGNNIFIDDFSVDTYPVTTQSYVSSAVVFQNTATTAKNSINQDIIGCRITLDGVASGATSSEVTAMLFNTIGSTNPPADITNAKLWYTGGSSSFDPTIATLVNTFVAPWATNYTFAGNFTGLQHGDNYFWITYDIPLAATSGNFVDAEWVNFGYRIIRTGTSGTIGTSVINVGSGTGFVVGAAISGTGIPGGSTISAVGATTITISSVLTASPPSVNVVLTSTPTVQTLPGNREIDVIYCIPQYFVGTSWLGYNTNDYIAQVIMAGNPTAPPGINNSLNSVGPNAGGCFGGPCPFSTHPPDYELFPAVPGKTAAITADGLTVYPISLKVGTYCCSNYIAAFIDFNKDGDFTDLGERIAQSGSLSNGQTYATTFVVPITATTGTTRMRVREVWIQPNIDPCNAATYGETEDYVVTILPTCGVPGWRTWLGFTDDWDNPSNWCGGVPTLADNARLPGSGGPGYTRPVIKTGVFATTRKLRVEPNDTLYIKAWTNSTLTVADSMYIQGNTSMVKVSSALIDTAQVFNGLLLPSNSLTPLKNSGKARSFWVFTQAELLARGLVAGDVVTDILLHINRLVTNSQSYRNVTIKYYYTTPVFVFVPGVGSVIPPVVTVGATIHTTATLSTQALIPLGTPFNWGTLTFPVNPGSFTWNGSTNKLVIEMCYDNTGFPNTNTSDQPRYTQTLGFRHYMTMLPAGATSPAACSMIPPTTQISTGSIATNTITVANGSILVLNQSVTGTGIPANTYISGIVGNIVTLTNNLTANIAAASLTFGNNVFHTPSDFRPNLTFRFDRPFKKYEIEVRGHWGNNGTFVPATSRVTIKGAIPLNIAGTSNTTFYDLRIDNGNHVSRQTDFTVTDTLTLTNGRLKLNNGTVNLTNNIPAALTRVNGFLQSDQDLVANNVGPYGKIHWNMGSVPATYLLPFVNAAGSYIPMDYVTTAGTHDVVIATHATTAPNVSTPAPITNINGYFTGTDNSANMVDRYFMIDNTAGSGGPVANINLRYANSERAVNGNVTMRAQRWLAPSAGWEFPFITGQTHTVGIPDLVAITGFNQFSTNLWWTITQNANPLPVSMLDFDAKTYTDKVKLMWQTASEIENSHFIVERTVDNLNFDFISRVESKGPSTSIINYSTWDEQPLEGIQYYYLRQFDLNGVMKSYGPVSATFTSDLFDILTATASNSEKGLIVEFDYNSEEPFKYTVVDMLGKVLAVQDKNVAQPGRNRIEIDVKLSQGVYQILLQNSEKVVSKKFYFDKL